MSGIADVKNRRKRRKRKSHAPTGEDLVMGGLLRRGFEVQLLDRQEHVLLVQAADSPKSIQVKTVHFPPWYVRRASFVRSPADQVTVYVLLGLERGIWSARFFVVRNSDLAAQLCHSPTSNPIGFIDAQSVEKYEDNWEVLR